jgi:hypothetical protein
MKKKEKLLLHQFTKYSQPSDRAKVTVTFDHVCTYSILAGGTPLSGQHLPNSPGRASICCMPVGYCVATPHRISAQCTGRSRAQIKNIGAAHTVVPVDRAVIDGDVELLHHPPDEPGAGNISSGKILSRRGITAAAPQ